MASQRLRGVLLCEDKEHERFFRQLLGRWFGRGRLYVNRIPNQEGAGDAFVIAKYAREVRQARRWRSENYALVVAIDGDRKKVRGRLRQLDRALTDAGLAQREKNEMIVVCVPTRNVETWELWLCGDRSLDEETDYKQRFHESEQRGETSTKEAVKSWFRSLTVEDERLEAETLPSLAAGRREIRRLES